MWSAWNWRGLEDMTSCREPFEPPHCPRRWCRYHTCGDGWHWTRHGVYRRRCEPRVIARYRCSHCGSTFSTQTFSTTYWLKRPQLQAAVFQRLLACSGYRQIAREAGCDPTTVMAQAARLGRHALLVAWEQRPGAPLDEPLVVDGFESFAYSQYHPLHLNTAVGSRSHYVYGFTCSPLRRKGRMSVRQRRRRAELERRFGRPDPRAVERGIETLLRLAMPAPGALVVRSDEHPAYPRALRRLRGWRVVHERTSSRAARTAGNPLFPVNLLDLLLRHNSANHKRETIAFSKREQSVVERAALLVVWRNLIKPFSERHGGGTPAMRLGLASAPWSVDRLLRWRRFPDRVGLPQEWQRYYRRELPTARIPNPRHHTLRLAF